MAEAKRDGGLSRIRGAVDDLTRKGAALSTQSPWVDPFSGLRGPMSKGAPNRASLPRKPAEARSVAPRQAALVGGDRSASAAQQRAQPGGDDATYWQLGREWLTGQGPRRHEFRASDPATQILRQHRHIQGVRDEIASKPFVVGEPVKAPYSLGGLQGVPDFLVNYSAVATDGRSGNLAAAYLGSYPLKYKVRSVGQDNVATVDFDVRNRSTIESAMRPPIIGYQPWYQERIGPLLNSAFKSGPGSATEQHFQWSERIPLRSRAANPQISSRRP